MTVETVATFYQQEVQNDERLINELKLAESPEIFAQKTAEIGQKKGYNFNAEDVAAFLNNQKPRLLTDADLEIASRSCPLNTRFTFCIFFSSCWGSVC